MLEVRDHRSLQAAVLAFKRGDRELKATINRTTRTELGPLWKNAVESNAAARGATAARVLGKGARVKAGNPPVAVAATSSRKLSGGLIPSEQWQPWEFGGQRSKVTTYTRKSKNGGTHQVTRHTSAQLPGRKQSGWVVYAAVAETAPRIASSWVRIIAETYRTAAEGN